MTDSEQIAAIGEAFTRGLRQILGGKLHGAYIYGAAAFPDDLPTGDIDFHVILTGPLTDDQEARLGEMHEEIARQFPPLGVGMDGYYLLLTDARRASPPQSQMWQRATDKSWALHREHIHAGRVLVLHGPDPKEIVPPATWPEIEQALDAEYQYVEDHLDEYPHYSILQLFRLIYSYETRDVVLSKAQAADWACDAHPQWRRHVELAKKAYARQGTEKDMQFMRADTRKLLEFAHGRIERARDRWRQQDTELVRWADSSRHP
jgi:hypothetical protein